MGEVYKAHDSKLGRQVAIKVIPAAFADNPERAGRFRREARMLAALNHPNIASIYSFEQWEGMSCLVMELVPGETLAKRLRGRPLTIKEALRIAAQIAEALEAAHRRGVIHRDLKPANVKVTPEGRVKLLDFGLAKALGVEERTDDRAPSTDSVLGTQEGKMMGTPSYMSPEQGRGLRVDRRTDIWAFGCVLYELLTNRRAFVGDTVADVLMAVCEREPDLRALGSGTPTRIRELLRRCLQKKANERLNDISDARIETEEAMDPPEHEAKPGTGTVVRAMAVLPFDNASGDRQMEYLSDGLTESLIVSLSQLPEVRVMARSTVFRFKGSDTEPQQLGRTLGVGAVLTGRVAQRGERLIISAELVDVENGWQLWGAQYRRKLADIFETEEEIAREISGALRLKLTPENEMHLSKRYTKNLDAYHLYLKGRFHWGKRTEKALGQAIEYFLQAIERDPSYARAYAGLAECYVPLAFYGHMFPEQAWVKGRAAAEKAVEIDPDLGEARAVLGMIRRVNNWDPAGAEEDLRTAIKLDPNYSRARQGLAECLVATGRFHEAAAEMACALELDPLSLSINAAVALIYYYGRRYDEAIEQFHRTINLDPTFFPAHWYLALAYEQKGQLAEAAAELEEAEGLANGNTLVRASLGGVYAAWGREEEAREILRELETAASRRYVSQVLIGVILSRLGAIDAAIDCLEKAYDDRCPWLSFLMADPKLDGLRAEAGFQDLARRVGCVSEPAAMALQPTIDPDEKGDETTCGIDGQEIVRKAEKGS
jgi:serine/threonine-protein kinase